MRRWTIFHFIIKNDWLLCRFSSSWLVMLVLVGRIFFSFFKSTSPFFAVLMSFTLRIQSNWPGQDWLLQRTRQLPILMVACSCCLLFLQRHLFLSVICGPGSINIYEQFSVPYGFIVLNTIRWTRFNIFISGFLIPIDPMWWTSEKLNAAKLYQRSLTKWTKPFSAHRQWRHITLEVSVLFSFLLTSEISICLHFASKELHWRYWMGYIFQSA